MVTIKADLPCKKISFFSDGYQLRGTLHLPTDACPPVVIGSHGLLSSSESPKQLELAKRCNEIGIAFFRFDHRGCGKSQGYFPEVTSLNTRARDLICAVNTIRARKDTGERMGLFGSSMGGAACLSVARQIGIDALVTFAAPIRSQTINRSHAQFNDPKRKIADSGYTAARFDIGDKLQCAENILIFHGDADDIVPYASALEIFEKAGEPKRLIRQKQGNHLMSRKAHQKEFIRETVQWFKSALF
jgi:alpha-beta hydrolase superfamily lysophospholipase